MQKETSTEWPIDEGYGVCRLSLATVYQEPRPGAGLVTQLLFGETYRVLEADPSKRYLRIESHQDKSQGWLVTAQHHAIAQEEFDAFNDSDYQLTTSPVSHITFKNQKIYLLPGSHLHVAQNELFDLSQSLQFSGSSRPRSQKADRDELMEIAQLFINTPFLSGGRSFFGLGAGSFVQLVYKIAGYKVPKFLSQLLVFGQKVEASAAQPGDLLIFYNEMQLPEHMGLYLGDEQIIHMKGKVRIDKISFAPKSGQKNISGFPNVHEVRKLI
ncbi:C40 family peptidase [Litoribacter alkaliphilus]|uniref:C40 family peptidase n=1 Tax=Litoribacter ruber TaxID=702568 RepID=A0AAP2CIW0_9BACT|nr:NlpC/P60 family protein [Litoribacter alkaliphilus]MBS9522627.1 C40 family peptidase [Litoribacter alkaliphilus]